VTSTNLARIFGFPQKGLLAVGKDADIVVVDAHKNWLVRKTDLFTKNQWSAFEGMTLQGKPMGTFLRGQLVYADGIINGEARGQWLAKC
jgi:dihydroorotase